MLRLLWVFLAFVTASHLADHARRIWRLYTDDRAPVFPTADDYLPTWMEAMYK